MINLVFMTMNMSQRAVEKEITQLKAGSLLNLFREEVIRKWKWDGKGQGRRAEDFRVEISHM